ncbi:MAG: site-specific integrase [Exiguobacterium sp.]|uniref:tyrosine-type recombinase/integrase n=1 Tax=Exiguobacterium sp. TaxID=44751 RepID=UPI00257CBDB0|nr:site-specific integrase [Exiguobacterium sp.]MBQ6459002.1 site-specific integrase [Exiguobacterium sp.]
MAGSIRNDGNTWYYILEIGRVNGKRRQKKKRGFKTKKEAQKALIEAEHAILQKGMYHEPAKTLYGEYLKSWLDDKKIIVKDSTYKIYHWLIHKHIIPYLGHIEISKIRPNDIQKLYNELITNDLLARENVQKIHSLINDSLNKAVKCDLINRNVASLVDRPKAYKSELSVWSIQEVKLFLNNAKTSRYHIAFVLALSTGMRQGEILALRWKDIDFSKQTLSIRQTLSHTGNKINTGAKTKSSLRNITLPEETINLLIKHKKAIQSEKRLADILYNDNDLVVCTNVGTPCSPRNLLRTFYSITKQSSVPRIRFHDLRHTHATLLLEQGTHPKVVSERLGHSNVRITLDTYSHVLPTMQVETANKLNSLLFN